MSIFRSSSTVSAMMYRHVSSLANDEQTKYWLYKKDLTNLNVGLLLVMEYFYCGITTFTNSERFLPLLKTQTPTQAANVF